jgi:hypothetical protein
MNEEVIFNRDSKFDIQLSQAMIDERRLGEIFAHCKMEKIELKSESFLWEQTGNICVEFRRAGKPSGISTTKADCWVHELKRDGETLLYLMFPIERLKALARKAIRAGQSRSGVGDGDMFDVALVRLEDILK